MVVSTIQAARSRVRITAHGWYAEHYRTRRDMGMLELTESGNGVRLTIKAVPGSSRDRIVGTLGSAVKIAVAAPPERGAANKAIIALLADRLSVHPSRITIARGHTSPRKEVFIAGITAAQALAALSDLSG
jgi:uncharacterized protein (TIGR00251 family)